MLRAFDASKSGMMAMQDKLDAISNNIANVNTDGYKSVDLSFQDLVYQTLNKRGNPVTTAAANASLEGVGTRSTQLTRDNSQGDVVNSGNSTDIAIDGPGYFAVKLLDGSTGYTRAGTFNIDATGNIVDNSGNKLEINYSAGGNAAVKAAGGFNRDNFKVSLDGTVLLTKNGADTKVGNINLYNAVGDNSMMSAGQDIYVPKPGIAMFKVTNSSIMQGYTENSNVDISKEMSEMIMIQREFDMSSTAIKNSDEMWGLINNMRK
jgi:flagellar basal-body rod protein FlgG